MSDNEITQLVQRIQTGRDEGAAHKLWDAYFERLVLVARKSLGNLPRATTDEEDLALSGFKSFFVAAENGRLRVVEDRDGLWRLLVTITIRKSHRYKERIMAQKRGGPAEARQLVQEIPLDGIPDERFVDQLASECSDLIKSLPDKTLREIATARMEGYNVGEIAVQRGVAVSTVKRKLARIRVLWTDDTPAPSFKLDGAP